MPCVRWQGKLIEEENAVHDNSYTDFRISKNTEKQAEFLAQNNKNSKQVERLEETSTDKIDEQVLKIQEKTKQVEERIETTQTDKNDEQLVENSKKEQTQIKDSISNFKLAESLINDLYNDVFSKSSNFKPTKNQTIGDLLIYLGYRAKSVGVYENFKKAFKITLNEDAVRSSENYLPLAIKLTVYLDKKQDQGYTKKVVSYLLKTILHLFEDESDKAISLTINSMSAIYSYLIENNINVN